MALNRLIFDDKLNDTLHPFLSDATLATIAAIPEIEWINVKNVLINLGYTVIELPIQEIN